MTISKQQAQEISQSDLYAPYKRCTSLFPCPYKEEVGVLDVSISQLKHAIRAIHQGIVNECKHSNSTYNGQASWCFDCKRIWLVEDIAESIARK